MEYRQTGVYVCVYEKEERNLLYLLTLGFSFQTSIQVKTSDSS